MKNATLCKYQGCYGILFKKHCIACKEKIVEIGKVIYLEYKGNNWHQKCFQCNKCKIRLCRFNFFEHNSQLFCRYCY